VESNSGVLRTVPSLLGQMLPFAGKWQQEMTISSGGEMAESLRSARLVCHFLLPIMCVHSNHFWLEIGELAVSIRCFHTLPSCFHGSRISL
jgi:hypothetical protein